MVHPITSVVFHATNVGILMLPDNLLTFKLVFIISECEFPCECGHTHVMAGGERSENNFMELGNFLLPLA